MAVLTLLTVPQDNDVAVSLSVLQADGITPQDCSGLSPQMWIKAGENADDSRAVELTTSSGLAWVNQSQGTLTASLTHTVLTDAGTKWWRLDLVDGGGDRTTAMYGPLQIVAV